MSRVQAYISRCVGGVRKRLPFASRLARWKQTPAGRLGWLWLKMVGVAFGTALVASIFIAITVEGGRLIGVVPMNSAHPVVVTVQLVVQALTFLLVCVTYLLHLRVPILSGLRLSVPSWRQFVLSIGVGVALVGLVIGIEAAAGLVPGISDPADHTISTTVENNPTVLVVLMLLSPLVLIPAEEILFRGIIQTRLKGATSARSAIVLSAMIFVGIHLPAFIGSGAVVSVVFVFISGIVLGWTFEWTDSLIAPMCAHSVYNTIVFTIAYLTF